MIIRVMKYISILFFLTATDGFVATIRSMSTCRRDGTELGVPSDHIRNQICTNKVTNQQMQRDPYVPDDRIIPIRQKGQVFLYRIALICASSASISGQMSKLLLASGSGVSGEISAAIEQNAQAILAWGILLAALIAPPNLGVINDGRDEDAVADALLLCITKILPGLASFALIVEAINVVQSGLFQGPMPMDFLGASDTLDKTTYLLIIAICLREIGFYGALYKVEAILAIIFCICSALSLNDLIGFSELGLSSLIALCLLVLSFGKVLEPIEDDLRPNKSRFFKDYR